MADSFNTNKIYSLIRKVALVAPALGVATGGGSPQEKINAAIAAYTGYDIAQKNFDPSRLIQGWGGYIGASVATRAVPAINKLIRSIV